MTDLNTSDPEISFTINDETAQEYAHDDNQGELENYYVPAVFDNK